MTINRSNSLNQIQAITDVWCDAAPGCTAAPDAGGCASAADAALRIGADRIAVPAAAVHLTWAWLENKGIEILAVMDGGGFKEDGQGAEKLSEHIRSVLKKGADGIMLCAWAGGKIRTAARIFEIADALAPVRNDLFFEKKLFVGMSLENIEPLDWPDIFRNLKKMGADGVLFSLTPVSGKGKNIAGKIFGALENWDCGFAGRIMFLADSPADIESALRLVEKIKPDFVKKLRFFIRHK